MVEIASDIPAGTNIRRDKNQMDAATAKKTRNVNCCANNPARRELLLKASTAMIANWARDRLRWNERFHIRIPPNASNGRNTAAPTRSTGNGNHANGAISNTRYNGYTKPCWSRSNGFPAFSVRPYTAS